MKIHSSDPSTPEIVDLVFHKRYKRSDHNRGAYVEVKTRHLECDRFTTAGGHETKSVFAVND